MIDIMYPLGTGSTWQDNEIRFSLRSVEKHLKGVGKVYVVGNKPNWLVNVVHIPAKDTNKIPDINICAKTLRACRSDISDTFLFMNDDHYLLSDFQADKFPFLHSGDLLARIQKRTKDDYQKRLVNTFNALMTNGLKTNNFDIHVPILYNKRMFKKIMEYYDWSIPNAFVIKSLYANSIQKAGRKIKHSDIKIHTPDLLPEGSRFFSTTESLNPAMKEFMYDTFQKRSIYEKQASGF